MRVFLGSSSQGNDDLEAVASLITKADMKPVKWTQPGTFFVGGGTWEALITLTLQVDAAAFIFRPDDQTVRKEHTFSTTRDNVILEFGLFSGALGPTRCAIFRRGNAWIPDDLKGTTYISLEDIQRAQDEVRHWADRMRATLELPVNLDLKQIAAVARAMLSERVPMNLVYAKLRKLGVPEVTVDDALAQPSDVNPQERV